MGVKHTWCIIIKHNTSSRAILWMRTCQLTTNSQSPFHKHTSSSAPSRLPALPWFNNDNAENWKILQITTINFPHQTERTFYDHFLREMLTERRSDSSNATQHRLVNAARSTWTCKQHRQDATPHAQASPRQHFCERWRWLFKTLEILPRSLKHAPQGKNNPSSAPQVFPNHHKTERPTMGRLLTNIVTTRHTLQNNIMMEMGNLCTRGTNTKPFEMFRVIHKKHNITKLLGQRFSSRRQQPSAHGLTPWREDDARTLQ